MEKSIDKHVEEALEGFGQWGTIEDLILHVQKSGPLPEEFVTTAARKQLAAVIRRVIKKRHDVDGLAEFESVERQTSDGETERVYKQIALFDREDFKLAIDYFAATARYHARKANSLTKRCNQQTGSKRQLPFPQFGLLNEIEAAG